MDQVRVEPGVVLDGRYRIVDRLGVGGMATVFRARDESLGRDVAVKVFPPAVAHEGDVQRRQGEVRLLAGLSHPALVILFDAALDAESPYLTMELVEGESLAARLRRGPLDADEFEAVGLSLAGALAYVHERGVVHRDVKPGNVLLPDAATSTTAPAKLADFGIALLTGSEKVTATGVTIGTAAYLSPEQVAGGAAGPASDIYALGILFVEALSGAHPYPGTALESAVARLSRNPELDAPALAHWRTLLERMTAQDPSARPTAPEIVEALSGVAPTRLLPAMETTQPMTAAAPSTPVDSDDETARLGDSGAAGPADVSRRVRRRRTRPSRGLRGRPLIIALLGVAAATAIGITVGLGHGAGGTPEDGSPDYPAVDGELGRHLELLQKSVEP